MNGRYLELVHERCLWQIVAGLELVVLLIVGIGFVWLSSSTRFVPTSSRSTPSARPWRSSRRHPAVIQPTSGSALSTRRLHSRRAAGDDRPDRDQERPGAGLRTRAGPLALSSTTTTAQNNPFEIAKTSVVVPTVTSLLRLAPTSWQIRWTETIRGLDGAVAAKSAWEAVLSVETVSPTSEETLLSNPLGLYVVNLTWTRQL